MTPEPERRGATRVTVTRVVQVGPGPDEVVSAHTRDLSLSGLYVYAEKVMRPGTRCTVEMLLEDRGPAATVRARGVVSRVDAEGMGIRFSEIADTESFTHLQNLVLQYAEDQEAVQLEFRERLEFGRDV